MYKKKVQTTDNIYHINVHQNAIENQVYRYFGTNMFAQYYRYTRIRTSSAISMYTPYINININKKICTAAECIRAYNVNCCTLYQQQHIILNYARFELSTYSTYCAVCSTQYQIQYGFLYRHWPPQSQTTFVYEFFNLQCTVDI